MGEISENVFLCLEKTEWDKNDSEKLPKKY